VFAGGSVDLSKGLSTGGSVIVCDGDFTVDLLIGCVVIARGDVRCKNRAENCRIIASGSVNVGGKEYERSSQIKQNEPKPLGFVKWFDPADVGVVVESGKDGVRVKKVDETKPFAKAGVKEGDLITVLGGTKAESPDAFRRRLRTAVVMEEELTLELRRDGKIVKLTVPLGQAGQKR
jgi:S1-C subfamily serine protease